MERRTARPVLEIVLGAIAGLVVGAIVALNLMIATVGDYGLSPSELFERNAFVAVLSAVVTLGGGFGGAVFMRHIHPWSH